MFNKKRAGGITAARTSVGVTDLGAALDFYTQKLGFEKVRSSDGSDAVVVQASPGQQIELVEGKSGRPERLTFRVADPRRWREHLAHVGIDSTEVGEGLELVDPDGVVIRLEP